MTRLMESDTLVPYFDFPTVRNLTMNVQPQLQLLNGRPLGFEKPKIVFVDKPADTVDVQVEEVATVRDLYKAS